ncbi:MAG: GAF domain-containing protein [Terriglobales bacterium]
MTQTATSPQRRPLLDEASFQKLLSAAFVLQEHNDRLRAKAHQTDFAENLSAIVETQKLIQTLQLDLAAAADLVAERVQKITHASGTAIGIIEKDQLFYRAATGSAAADAGTRVPCDSALSGDCLSKGSALNYPDVTSDLHVHSEFFRDRNVKAFIAVPVYHAGQVAGVLELRFGRANSFREADLRTAELMAGLLSEAMVTAARMKWKEALASERQSMLEALERIKPQIERLGNESIPLESDAAAKPLVSPFDQPAPKPDVPAVRKVDTCTACGSGFFDEGESFCGICGTARPAARIPVEVSIPDLTSKADPPWLIPYGQEKPTNGNSGAGNSGAEHSGDGSTRTTISVLKPSVVPDSEPANLADEPPVFAPPAAAQNTFELRPALQTELDSHAALGTPSADTIPADLPSYDLQPPFEAPGTDSLRIVPADPVPFDHAALTNQIQAYPWSSAKKAHAWLETVKAHHGPRAEWLAQQWQRRRANIYVVVAVVIFLLVISGWGIRPAGTKAAANIPTSQPSRHQAPAPPKLTLFEELLVNLGLAEPPPAPVYRGNPETQVWVDVHTALYYCPGSNLNGKTADGKYETQRDAQQDQFEPAKGKACP